MENKDQPFNHGQVVDNFLTNDECGIDLLEKDDQTETTERDKIYYIANMSRKASTHSAKSYKFNAMQGQSEAPPIAERAKKIHLDKFQEKFKKYLEDLDKVKYDNVSLFQDLQVKILSEILTLSKELQPLAITASSQVLPAKLRSVASTFWTAHSCPHAENKELFNLLSIKVAENGNAKIKFEDQMSKIKSADRCLGCLPDPRCGGFGPTFLQTSIMNEIDKGNSIVVRSPASSGKTMLSLYLVQVTKGRGKKDYLFRTK
jgi:superfamily II RNA helicase